MKFNILIFIFFSLIYYVFEAIFNRISMGALVESDLKKKDITFFCYASLWMLPIGGICAVIINLFYMISIMQKLPIIIMMLIGGLLITLVEFGSGLFLNKFLKLKIWDYSNSYIGKIPVNFMGQIDIFHSLGWIGITYFIVKFIDFLLWVV